MFIWSLSRRRLEIADFSSLRFSTEWTQMIGDRQPSQAGSSRLRESPNQSAKINQPAVVAALTYEWSNGRVEGQVNRLKLVKRTMYGRAKPDLLKARMLKVA